MTAIRTQHARLFTMMLLQFFIWGAWLRLIFGYLPALGFSPSDLLDAGVCASLWQLEIYET